MITLTGSEKFKSEEDRLRYLEDLPDLSDPTILADLPSGKTIDDFTKEIEKNANIAMELPVDAEAGKTFDDISGAPKQEPNPAPQAQPDPQPNAQPNPTVAPESSFDKELVERRISKMQGEYENKLKESQDKISTLQKEMEEKLKSLQPEPAPEPKVDPQVDAQLKEKISRAKEIARLLGEQEDLYGDDAQKLLREQAQINADTLDLEHARTEEIRRVAEEKIKAAQELAQKTASEIKEERESALEEKKRRDAERQASEVRTNHHKMMDLFKEKSEAFKSARPYSEMENDYLEFSNKLASLYYGDKLPEEISQEEREVAFAKYKNKVPALIEKVKESGVKVPHDLETYDMLSEVGAMYNGSVFNKQTGEWEVLTNSAGVKIGFPDVETAYDYYLRKNGMKQDQIIKAQRDAIQQYQNASDRRANPVELDNSYQQSTPNDMTEERALKIVDDPSYETSELVRIAREGERATDPEKLMLREFNRAMEVLKLDPIG